MGKKEITDLNKSNLRWSGNSEGIFNLVSLTKLKFTQTSNAEIIFGLGNSVMAGNVYHSKNLLKQPPYLFQLAGSFNYQIIYRTFLKYRSNFSYNNEKNIDDSYRENLFDKFQINILKKKCSLITSFNELYESGFHCKLMCCVVFNIDNKYVEVEFPINHINLKKETKEWQVETGPVLLPMPGKSNIKYNILPSFVHFNNLNSIDIFYDYPFGFRTLEFANKGIFKGLPCVIEIYKC